MCIRDRKITLPLLKPTVIILVIMSLGRMFSTDFGLFYQVPQDTGMLYEVTTTIDTFVYRALMKDHDIDVYKRQAESRSVAVCPQKRGQ